MEEKKVWLFKEGNAKMRELLGGKGANLAEMTNIGLPVPPGLTITTKTCMEYIDNGNNMPDGLMEEVKNKEKPTFKDLVAIMLAQYAIILPMVFGGLIIFAIILYILMAWLK